MKIIKNIPRKLILYTVLFGFVCVINQRIQTMVPTDGWKEVYRDLTGLVVAVLVLSHYAIKDIWQYKKFHLIWAVLGGAGCIGFFLLAMPHVMFLNELTVLTLLFYIWGFVLVQTALTIIKEHKCPQIRWPFAVLWLAMIGWMSIARHEEIWPLPYGIMFAAFYLTDYDKEERSLMFEGLLNGLIASFFVFQGHCFLYRPYEDMNIRYVGWFNNTNNNVLYYCFVLAAVLVKLYICRKKQVNKWWHIYYWLGLGVVLSFVVLTIGRIGWITAFVLVLLFLIFQKKSFRMSIIKYGLVVLLCTAITFPACFAAARYIPPLRHHVVWFYLEYDENKVHSWDPWNSWKYVELDEFAEVALGRIVDSLANVIRRLPFVVESDAAPVYDRFEPMFASAEELDNFGVRIEIYKYFAQNLNWFGYKIEEIGFFLYPEFWVYHAHDLYLQYGIQFGIPAMVLFTVLLFCGIYACFKRFRRTDSPEAFGYMLFMLIPAVFGLFELTWGSGHMAITLLFVAWRMLFVKEEC